MSKNDVLQEINDNPGICQLNIKSRYGKINGFVKLEQQKLIRREKILRTYLLYITDEGKKELQNEDRLKIILCV
jgi:hypothetical protein